MHDRNLNNLIYLFFCYDTHKILFLIIYNSKIMLSSEIKRRQVPSSKKSRRSSKNSETKENLHHCAKSQWFSSRGAMMLEPHHEELIQRKLQLHKKYRINEDTNIVVNDQIPFSKLAPYLTRNQPLKERNFSNNHKILDNFVKNYQTRKEKREMI